MNVFKAEFRRFLKAQTLSNYLPIFIFLYIFFWVISFSTTLLLGNIEETKNLIAQNMFGYIIWFFVISAISSIPQEIGNEVVYGTFEHLHLSTANIKTIFLMRSIMNALSNSIIIFFFVVFVSLIHKVNIFTNISSIWIFLILLFGLYGFAYVLAGFVLMFRGFSKWLGLVNFLLIIPLMIPEKVLSPLVKEIISYFPIYEGVVILRKINLLNIPLNQMNNDILKLLISSVLFFLIGLLIFDIADKKAKKLGKLGAY